LTGITEEFDRNLKVNLESEKMFREKCDENHYTYMYIDQNFDKYSSKIYEEKSKRPDYILSIPHLGSIFIDVKGYSEKLFFEDSLKFNKEHSQSAFWLKKDEIFRFVKLQEETSIKVWFAVIPVRGDSPMSQLFFLPVDRALKFIAERHKIKPEWDYVQIPLSCFIDCSKLAQNKCGGCKRKYCDEVEELLNIDDKVHFKKYGKQQ